MTDARPLTTTTIVPATERGRKAARELTPKQARFVDEYLIDLNATQAAIRAGYSACNAGKIGPELLGKTGIRAALRARQDALSERAGVRQEQVIAALAAIAFADIADYVEPDDASCRLRPMSALSRTQRLAIADVTQLNDGFRLRLHCKLRALDMLARHLGLYHDG